VSVNDAKIPILDAVLIFGVVGFAMIWIPLAFLFAAGFYGAMAFVVDRRSPDPGSSVAPPTEERTS
jgi:hypothetical protein